jgi:Domain of unknown function (DUF932)
MKAAKEDYDFPVQLEPIATASGRPIPGYKAIVRTDTDEPLKVVTNSYHLLTHKQALELTNKFLATFGDYTTQDTIEKNGLRFVRQCTFANQDLTIRTPKINDVVKMQLSVMNTYDGKSSLWIKICAKVLKCLNGMTAPGGSLNLHFRHTGGIKDLVLPDPEQVLSIFKRGGESWNDWAEEDLTRERQEAILHHALELGVVSETLIEKWPDLLNPPTNLELTIWDYFNNFTNIITHHLPKVQLTSKIARLDRLNGIFRRVVYGKDEPGFEDEGRV